MINVWENFYNAYISKILTPEYTKKWYLNGIKLYYDLAALEMKILLYFEAKYTILLLLAHQGYDSHFVVQPRKGFCSF